MPIAGYVDFGSCVKGMQDKQGYDEETAKNVCGAIKRDVEEKGCSTNHDDVEKADIASKYLNELKDEYGNEARLFIGTLSVDSVDKEGDQITTDAFKKVMPTFMRRGVLIDSHSNKVIGRPLKYWIDEHTGSTTVGWQIYEDYHIDDDVWNKIRNGTYEGMSIGGFAHPDSQETVCDGSGCKVIITEIELWEGSAVKRGANTEAVILAHNELAKSGDGHNELAESDSEPVVECDEVSCKLVPKTDGEDKQIQIMPEDSGIINKSENTMTDKTEEPKDAVTTGSVDTVDASPPAPAGEVEKQDDMPVEGEEPVGATNDEKLDAVIELLQNISGRVEALEDLTAPSTGEEEVKADEEPEKEEDEVEKSATELATDVATKAIDQVTKALPGMINKSLKNAGIIHTPRPEMKAEAGKPLEKQDDKVVSMADVSQMGKDDVRQAGNGFAMMATRDGR